MNALWAYMIQALAIKNIVQAFGSNFLLSIVTYPLWLQYKNIFIHFFFFVNYFHFNEFENLKYARSAEKIFYTFFLLWNLFSFWWIWKSEIWNLLDETVLLSTQKQMLKLMDKKIFTILRWNFLLISTYGAQYEVESVITSGLLNEIW